MFAKSISLSEERSRVLQKPELVQPALLGLVATSPSEWLCVCTYM